MIDTVLIPNMIAMLLLMVLLFSANGVSRHMLLDSKIFVLMIICNYFQCVGEIVSYAIDGIMLPGFHVLNLIVNALLFMINIFFAFLWVIYADYKIFEDIERVRKRGRKLCWPGLIIIVGSIVNIFVPIFFRVTSDNQYERTILYFIPYLVTYFYLAYGTGFIYRYKSQARKYVFLPALVFMLPIFVGSGVQFFAYGVSTVWVGVSIALVAVYVNVQNEVSYTDALSGLYNRVYMYQYLETAFKKKDHQKKIAGIMMDIDEFKKINDTYGHLIGDDAIRSTGKIILTVIGQPCIAVRYGGDEFVVLLQIQTEDDIKNTLELITKEEEKFNSNSGKKYILHFSKGYSILNPKTDTVDSFLERMDRAMYEEKRARKQHKDDKKTGF